MNSIALFFETKQGKYIKNFIIGLGASVVLMGALFKIQHWPGAGIMLTVGMVTEAFIFALLGLLPPHKDYYWERFYPGIDENPHVEAYRKGVKFDSAAGKTSPGAALDKMMEDAQIAPANIRRLGDNLQRFGTVVEQIKDISDITSA
ncbi:MAG: gliding motility protein GldL, partial [Sphingobacteriales bacterium]